MHWLVLVLRDARTHVRSLPNVFGGRAPQDEDEHRVVHSSRFQTAHLVPAAGFPRPGFASLLRSPRMRVGGAPRDVRVLGGTPVRRIMCVKDARERAYDAIRQAPSEAPCVP